MYNVWTIAWATYGEVTRRPVYVVTLVLFALLVFCSSFLTQFGFFQEVNMVREMGMTTIALWGFIVVVVLTGAIVTQELEDRTAITLLCKPLRRSGFLLGKYLGLLMSVGMGMVVLAAALFYTLWWMAKGSLFSDPQLAIRSFLGGTALLVIGGAIWSVATLRVRRLEADTAVSAPRRTLFVGLILFAVGSVLIILAVAWAGRPVSEGDAGQFRLLLDHPRYRELARLLGPDHDVSVRLEAAREIEGLCDDPVWEFLGSFMKRNGLLVGEGFLLSFLQVVVLASICVSVAAFAPPVVSVAVTAVAYLFGNLSSIMLGSVERMESPPMNVAGRLLSYLLPNLSYFNLQTHFSEGRIISLEYLLLAILYAAIYSVFAFTVSCSLFERREIR